MEGSHWENLMIKFQAHARGYLMREEVSRARKDFEDIVKEIDGDLTHLQWRETIVALPYFTDTDGAFFGPSVNSSARKTLKPAVDISVCQPPAPLSEEGLFDSCLPPVNLKAERDCSHRQGQAFFSGVCYRSSPASEEEGGQRDSCWGSQMEDGGLVMESTEDTTTVWNSLGLDLSPTHAQGGPQHHCLARGVPCTREALRLHRNTLAMELLWLQQAIASRKKYLSLKERLSIS
ncbi:IQ domain-containing protein C [Lampris incognitus]|uniref:IQ domain-containing protein C n=1 Tax=Lampris incognitus TaxID=2546036 RepID=UPI0024B4AD9F|nr:IQ domain-containing protein C [Lampris incognitus]